MKAITEEKARAAERLRELRQEEERISAERERCHERTAALEQEKQRLEKLALSVKQRSAELDAISDVSHVFPCLSLSLVNVKSQEPFWQRVWRVFFCN